MAMASFLMNDPRIYGLVLLNAIPVCILMIVNGLRWTYNRRGTRAYIMTPSDPSIWKVVENRNSKQMRPVNVVTDHIPAGQSSEICNGTNSVSGSSVREKVVNLSVEKEVAGTESSEAGPASAKFGATPGTANSVSNGDSTIECGILLSSHENVGAGTYGKSAVTMTAAGRQALASRLQLDRKLLARTFTPDSPLDFGADSPTSPITPSRRPWK